MSSVHKGKRGERKATHYVNDALGFEGTERNARNGKADGDLICPALPNLFIEVKDDKRIRVGTSALVDAIEQACRYDLKRKGVVLWNEHRKGWRLSWFHDTGAQLIPMTTWSDINIREMLVRLNEEAGHGK